MDDTIIYVGFYAPGELADKRYVALSSVNKMNYIADALARAGFSLHFISPSWITDAKAKWTSTKQIRTDQGAQITLCPSVGTSTKWGLHIKIALTLLWLFLQLIKYARKGVPVLVYHSPMLALPIRWAKKLKHFKLVLEVEEIYSEVWGTTGVEKKWEMELLSSTDKYIVVSELLALHLGSSSAVVSYGSYSSENIFNTRQESAEIRLVYAGLVDGTNGCERSAVNCLRFLPDYYTLHICGYGRIEHIKELQTEIEKINLELKRIACIFHGELHGRALLSLLADCDIGLNPRVNGHNYDFSFPSKILMYLGKNLRVVSTRMKSVTNSKISHLLTYSEETTPESFANAIQSVDISSTYDSRAMIHELDLHFVEEMRELMQELRLQKG